MYRRPGCVAASARCGILSKAPATEIRCTCRHMDLRKCTFCALALPACTCAYSAVSATGCVTVEGVRAFHVCAGAGLHVRMPTKVVNSRMLGMHHEVLHQVRCWSSGKGLIGMCELLTDPIRRCIADCRCARAKATRRSYPRCARFPFSGQP